MEAPPHALRRFAPGRTAAHRRAACRQCWAHFEMNERLSDVRDLLLKELHARGIPARETLSGNALVVTIEGDDLTVGLENIARNHARDRDGDSISGFVDGVLATRRPLPPWPEAASGIRFSAEPSDHDFRETVHERITPGTCRVLAYTDPQEARVSWLTPSLLNEWCVSTDVASQAAAANMNGLLADVVLEIVRLLGTGANPSAGLHTARNDH
jgi:hypothetical protein